MPGFWETISLYLIALLSRRGDAGMPLQNI